MRPFVTLHYKKMYMEEWYLGDQREDLSDQRNVLGDQRDDLFAKNISEKNIFHKKTFVKYISKKKMRAKLPCCPQGLG